MLRITFVRGIDRDDLVAYAVHVSPEIGAVERAGTTFYMASRINRMQPRSSFNLDPFLAAYASNGAYTLAARPFDANSGFQMVDRSLSITKRKLIVREAWDIGDNDPDMVCLGRDSIPVIPDRVKDAPSSAPLHGWLLRVAATAAQTIRRASDRVIGMSVRKIRSRAFALGFPSVDDKGHCHR